jgi:hypothetical protein
MKKRSLLIEKYTSIIELDAIKNEIVLLKKRLNELKDKEKFLTDRVCDINFELKHFSQLKPLLEPKYK